MIMGVDIGGTNIDIILFNGNFKYLKSYKTREDFFNLNRILNDLVAKYGVKKIGIGFAGWIKDRKVIKAPNLPSKDLDLNLNIDVYIDNDANCFSLFSAKKFGYRNLIGVTVGTGIGSGIVVDGKIYRGGGLAGEIGHWFVGGSETCTCGGIGHLECHFGGWSIKRKYKIDAEMLGNRIYEIDGFKKLCIAVANAVMLLDPEAVVFGGRIGGSLNVKKLREGIYSYLMDGFNPDIITLNDPLAVAKGACLLALGD